TLVADGVEVQVRDSATVNAGLQSHNGAAIRFMQDLVVNAPITLDGGDISVAGNVSLQQSPIPGTELTGELATGGVLTVPDNNLVVDGYILSLGQDHSFNNITLVNSAVLTTRRLE